MFYSIQFIFQDIDDICNICWTSNLGSTSCIKLNICGHIFHSDCIEALLKNRWNGPRITFGFSLCPLCKATIEHDSLLSLTAPIKLLYNAVKAKSLQRLKYDNLETCSELTSSGSVYYNDPTGYSMHKYAYYLCYKCANPYFGGAYECAAVASQNFDPSELLCGSCSPFNSKDCPKHGKEYLEFKCRFCCSISVWFCFGTTHFCEPCHNNHGTLTSMPIEDLAQCPCLPNNRGLPKLCDDIKTCPLGVEHPKSGSEFALGCGLCRQLKSF